MNKNTLKNIIAVFIIIGSILSLGVKFTADGDALRVDRPTYMRVTPDNNLAIMIGKTIHIIDPDGFTRQSINFESQNISIRGDFDFFSNGDFLIYHSDHEATFQESLARYFRIKDTREGAPFGIDGLYRCSRFIKKCALFTQDIPNFSPTFRLFIDRETDTVYISDSQRFAIYKISHKGVLLAGDDTKLRFPSQMELHNNKLHIVNTNYHAIKIVQSDTDNFGKEITSHRAVIEGERNWPSELIRTPYNWWVGISNDSMASGRVKIFNDNWQAIKTPYIDADADIIGMAYFADEVWVGDWKNFRIFRFDAFGERLKNFHNPQIDAVFNQSRQAVIDYEKRSLYGLIAFGIVFVFGLLAAYILEKETTIATLTSTHKPTTQSTNDLALETPPGNDVYWIETKHKKHQRLLHYSFIMIIGTYILLALMFLLLNNSTDIFFDFIFITSVIPVMLSYSLWKNIINTKIGISGELLLIDDGRGNIGVGKKNDIRYAKTILIIRDVAIIIGHSHNRLFPKEEFNRWVEPRLHRGEAISVWRAYKILWEKRHPVIVIYLVIFLYVSVLLTLLEFF